MANIRTVDFLPEIFQTPANKQFLSATLDQLVQEPEFKKSQGFIGRRVGPGVNPNDGYVSEMDESRAEYQLEPGVVRLDASRQNVVDAITYPGINDALNTQGADVSNSDRLYTSDYYTWDPFVNFDKFVNFSQYYWMPNGPTAVDVFAGELPTTDEYNVTRTNTSYRLSGEAGTNPEITLVRGGTYTFNVNQSSQFWIQQQPGTSGTLSATPNISSRSILGVSNNGASTGTVTFNVPSRDDQAFYYNLPSAGTVDLVSNLKFNQINNIFVSEFIDQYGGIDGVTNLDGRTIILTNPEALPEEGGWLRSTQFDPLAQSATNNGVAGSYDTLPYDEETVVPDADRYSIWRIQYISAPGGDPYITLTAPTTVSNLSKVSISFGVQWSNTQWWKDSSGYWNIVPNLTALFDTLYYQDGTTPGAFGVIRLIDDAEVLTLDINSILGRKIYTSPNGVVFTNNLKVVFRGSVVPATYQNTEYYVAGVGTAIKLLPVSDYITPEEYIDQDVNDILDVPDYLVMSLDSPSLSAWSRVNRWFHVDVIAATAEYTNTDIVIDNNFRAKRPILEYRGGIKLFNMGTSAAQPANVIDFTETDALSNINGSIGYSINGYQLVNGSRVIFAADTDPQVRNKIYVVEFIVPDLGDPTPIINLTQSTDSPILADQSVLMTDGNTVKGQTYYYDGVEWKFAQQKTARNQAPLFDVFDLAGVSYGDNVKYPSTSFVGSKLFSYAQGTGSADTILGFALKYLTLANVGDIVFDNNFYTDTFLYVKDTVGTTENISNGVIREYADRTSYVTELGWQTAITKSKVYQQFTFAYNSVPLVLDVPVTDNEIIPGVKIFVDGVFQLPGTYTLAITATNTSITLSDTTIPVGTNIVVLALSDVPSAVGFYQVPDNLENNPLNENSSQYTLGTARAHYQTIAENLLDLTGTINGANNTRDLGNIIPYGLKILQQSSPMTMAGYFMRSAENNIFAALEFNSREYEKFKSQLLSTAVANDYNTMTVPAILDSILDQLSGGKTDINSFYWSDMLPSGSVYTEINTTYTAISIPVFDTVQVYNFTSANYLGLLVYVNGLQLIRNLDYTVATDGPRLTITSTLVPGDVITIREYTTTTGSFVPNTPTKLGLYQAYRPRIYVDETYTEPTTVIRGHDGSITIAFGDFRDDLLLEFERRIYNNIKLDGNPIPLVADDVVPGQFRTTDYSLTSINEILSKDFLSWVGWNKLDYKTQDYQASNEFTWNYSSAGNNLNNNSPMFIGAWRGIYEYFYDTITPNTTPWQMLGFTEKPDWWEAEYGTVPYTSGNMNLWDDLEAGLVRDPAGVYVIEKYKRPGLTSAIPSGSEGQLLPPLKVMIGNYSSTDFRKSWQVGDDGPVENAWRTSSAYPFAVMRLLALTRPAEFFSLFADRDLYKFDTATGQYLYNNRYRLDANGIQVYGNGLSKASYVDWIVDFNRQTGINSTTKITADLQALDVRLCYRMAGFSAKNLLQIVTEKSSPDSTNSGLLLPDESYNLMLYKNVPFDTLTYSGVIVQRVDNGYSVWGYSALSPAFEILKSQPVGVPVTLSGGGVSVQVYTSHTDQVVTVPYGYTFASPTAVADFLISYGALLESKGMIFSDSENGYVLNWQQMVTEFLYWTGQSWGTGSLINLNPNAQKLVIERPFSIVDNISLQTQENLVLDQDRKQLTTKDLIVDRQENRFSIETTNNQTISFINLKFVSYEHMIVLDNRSIFADLIYDPVTDARQSRVKLIGAVSANWNGQLNAPGFILNQDNIQAWDPLRKYARGEIVNYKNYYYSALDIVEPSATFNYAQWTRSDFTKIQQGLLPNLSNKSDQLENTYSVNSANLERDQDLFSYGLIGFRPREYMTALNLDDVSQVNLYQQFLGSKGTLRAAEIFKFADLGRGPAEFDIYENWAVQRAVYGANANRSYYELQLNEALLKSNPSLIQVIGTSETSSADQSVLVNNIWKESYNITSPDILTTTTILPTDTGLPTAGYVNFDDVDITMFDIDNTDELNQQIDSIGIDSIIWVAKTNSYDWGVFRCYGVPGRISTIASNLNGTSTVTFTQQHGLATGDIIIIKSFDNDVDGVYRVLYTPTLTSIAIVYEFADQNNLSIAGNGVGLSLETLRVAQASDAVTLPESNRLIPGSKIWIDNNGSDLWTVIEKQDVFTARQEIIPDQPVTNSNLGASAAQATQNLFAIVGVPNYSTEGAIICYVRTDVGQYQQTTVVEGTSTGSRSLGKSVTIGDQNWMAAGAPNSQWHELLSTLYQDVGFVTVVHRETGTADFISTQLLTPPGSALTQASEFGYSVALSQDEHYLYVGAPGVNRVFAYGLVEVETQVINYITSGVTNEFVYNDTIVVNDTDAAIAASQLSVVLNNEIVSEIDFVVNLSTGKVEITSTPPGEQTLTIARRTAVVYDADGSTTQYTIANSLYTINDIYSFTVFVNGALQRPNVDYTFNPGTGVLTLVETDDGGVPWTNGNSIEVRAASYFKLLAEIEPPEVINSDARFGQSVTSTTDGQQVIIGASHLDIGSVSASGGVYVFDRSAQRFIINDATQTAYTVNGTLVSPTAVKLNNRFLTNIEGNITGDYSITGDTVTLTTAPAVGDELVIDVNTFEFMQKIVAPTATSYSVFGSAVDICPNDCSIYIGAPGDIAIVPQAGFVQRNVNQSRVFGTIQSGAANPAVYTSDSIRINNVEVIITEASPTVADVASAINSANIPNVLASVTANLTFAGTGLTTSFNIGSVYSAAESYTPVVLLDDVEQTLNVDYTYNNTNETITFAVAPLSTSTITVVTGRLILTAKNLTSFKNRNQLFATPGVSGSALWTRLDFNTYAFTQTIVSPAPSINAHFGSSLMIDSAATTLVVGAPGSDVFRETTFDNNTTLFDAETTVFSATTIEAGVVYSYDFLPSVNTSVENPGKFIFGQQIYDTEGLGYRNGFGTAVSYLNQVLLVTSPGADTTSVGNAGKLNLYINENNLPAWVPIRVQAPFVDTRLINSVFVYDIQTGAKTEFFDFIDPLQGKILGAAQQNLDFISAVDPAAYNVGVINNYGRTWGAAHVGQIWWDTTNARFVNPHQNDIVYASRRWGQIFPGSTIDVMQWTVNDVPPAEYTGEGTPHSIESYTVINEIDASGVTHTKFYYWVQGITTINNELNKTLSPVSIARYIADPRSSGIAYVAFINGSTTALYNALTFLSAEDTVLSIEFDREQTDNAVHVEYELVPDNRADGFISDILYRKFQDSLCGVDSAGNLVPDPNLRPANKYGVQFRPRQTMFVDRLLALKNYLTRANSILALYPITETKNFTLLNSEDPQPDTVSGEWNKKVANIEELSYQNFLIVPVGYRYLVESDSTEGGLWTIYEVTAEKTFASLQLVRVQTYKTNRYWSHIDWYQVGYNASVRPLMEIDNVGDLETINVPVGSIVRVRANAQGKFEIYLLESTNTWIRVGLQDGTIQFNPELWDYQLGRFGFDVEVFDSQYFDQEPVIETRKIIQAINQNLFIDELAIERNRAMILMFNFILSEQIAPEWITKTSLVDVDHKIRQLLPYDTYNRDNQEFVIDYFQEVKPYHVQVREFNLIYEGFDIYKGTMTDFDVPAYWKTDLAVPQFVSPVLTPYTLPTAVGTGRSNTISDAAPSSSIWQDEPWSFWYNNYTLGVQSIAILDGGSGYTVAPTVTINGDATVPATFTTIINGSGEVTDIVVLTPGSGYLLTPTITITGTGTGARAVPIMGNNLVRSISTKLKYDRCEYTSDIVDWEPNVSYDNGTLVRYENRVWEANNSDSSPVINSVFDPEQWLLVPAGTLSAANRTQGYYTPRPDMPGLDLPLLIDGIDYPGVQVAGPLFSQDTGFDVGNYDINLFDNINFGPEGKPTYSADILDSIYESNFLDSFLGTRARDVNVEGGAFVDTYSSHAPEELVPGSEFDTLDFKVFTTPGADWTGNGHGFEIQSINWQYNSSTATTFSFDGLVDAPVQVRLLNETTGVSLVPGVDYTVNWAARTVTVIGTNVLDDAVVSIYAYGLGGGNQLFKHSYLGTDIGNSLFIPVTYSLVTQSIVFVNGEININYGLQSQDSGTLMLFDQTFGPTDFVTVALLSDSEVILPVNEPYDDVPFDSGTVNGLAGSFDFSGLSTTGDILGYSWSTPITEYFTATPGQTTFTLTKSFIGNNQVTALVEVNGVRATPAAGIEHLADGSTAYTLPTRIGTDPSNILDADVLVWVDNTLKTQGTDYVVEPYAPGDEREIIFVTPPLENSTIQIFVTTQANYIITPGTPTSTLTWRNGYGINIGANDIVAVTTWNSTDQQNIMNRVFVGPITTGITTEEGFDSVGFDTGSVSGGPGTFDYSIGVIITINDFILQRHVADATRLVVTLNGHRLIYGVDFVLSDSQLVLASGPINAADVLAVTIFTDNVVPDAMTFRIFQDMRGVAATYRILGSTTTQLEQPLLPTDDVIYVRSVSALSVPDLANNVWGVITINGERIMYRELDTLTNTVSSLLRGTAGTAIASHAVKSVVYNMSRFNLAPSEYQDRLVSSTYIADGVETEFVTTIDLSNYDIDFATTVTEVWVGGALQPSTSYYILDVNPLTVVFDDPPAANLEIVIYVKQGFSWYQPGEGTPSNGQPLQETNTIAARFFKGLY